MAVRVKEGKKDMNWINEMIETEDGALLYTRHIGQGQPLLLIHGAVVDSEFFTEFGEIMAQNYLVITYDRRGYGYSRDGSSGDGSSGDGSSGDGFSRNGSSRDGSSGNGSSGEDSSKDNSSGHHSSGDEQMELYPGVTDGKDYYRRQAEDACLVLKEYSKEPAVVLGCSAGSFVAMALAAQHPNMVCQLFIQEPPAYILMRENVQVWNIIDEIKENIRNHRYNRALNRFILFVTNPREIKKEMNQHEVDFFMQNGNNFIRNEYLPTFSCDILPEKLPEGMDAMVLCGKETGDDPHGIAAKRVADRFGLKLAYMPGFHNAVRELSEEFAEALNPFLLVKI